MESDGIIERYAIEYLRAHGAIIEGAHIKIGDWPVQFLPAADPLLQEAMKEAGVESGILNGDRFASIISRHGLDAKWALFTTQFLGQR